MTTKFQARAEWLASFGWTLEKTKTPDFGLARDSEGIKRCGSKTSKGKPCRAHPLKDGNRCRIHGSSPRGPDSPNWKHGGRAAYIPGALIEHYQHAANNPQLLSLAEDIALLDVRINQVTAQLAGARVDAWSEVAGLLSGIRKAETVDQVADLALDLEQLIEQGQDQALAWTQYTDLIEQRRKLVESERKAMIDLGQMLTMAEVIMILSRAGASVRENVSNSEERQRVIRDIERLLLPGGTGAST